MPTYVWRNKKTQEIVEIVRPISKADVPPNESQEWEKVFSPTALVGEKNKGNWGKV